MTPDAAVRLEPLSGVHPVEWLCELIGTALLLICGISAICFDFGTGSGSLVASHLSNHSLRLLITGLLFAGSGSLVAISPLGRCSGAHLNPAVTTAFWLRGNVHPHDALGYCAAQFLGGLAGIALVDLLWGSTLRHLGYGATLPGDGLSDLEAAGVELVMTAVLVLAILFMTSHPATARWTPLVVWLVVATLVWQGARFTGTSLNPARSFAPALLGHDLRSYWVYVVGPLGGAVVAAWLHRVLPGERPVTAKLFHDPAYRSSLGGSIPVAGR